MQRCHFCSTTWVDRATAETGIRLTALERRRLIAALLARQHLILSGPACIGKRRLAYELALSIVDGQQYRVCLLQGHPWWAARTSDVGYFVNLQSRFSMWQMAHFTTSVLNGTRAFSRESSKKIPPELNLTAQAEGDTDSYVVCVECMSPAEIDLYFRVILPSFSESVPSTTASAPVRLIGTYDSLTPLDLDEHVMQVAALVHLGRAHCGNVKEPHNGSQANAGQ